MIARSFIENKEGPGRPGLFQNLALHRRNRSPSGSQRPLKCGRGVGCWCRRDPQASPADASRWYPGGTVALLFREADQRGIDDRASHAGPAVDTPHSVEFSNAQPVRIRRMSSRRLATETRTLQDLGTRGRNSVRFESALLWMGSWHDAVYDPHVVHNDSPIDLLIFVNRCLSFSCECFYVVFESNDNEAAR